MTNIRTRFAPSPTGYLHVGGIRTALFAYLLARQSNGQFVLRLEDTDKKREVDGSSEHLISSLKALGLQYDEGPDVGGVYGPYRQSERLERYHKYAKWLIEQGRAYADPYTAEEMQTFRDDAQKNKRAFLYRNQRPENPPTWDGTMPLRFKSEPKTYHWHDAVMGDLTAHPENIDDFVLIKSDGYPTYDFAHIIDDLEMHISHVIRGQEFISSMPKYLNLYEALGFDMSAVETGEAKSPSVEGSDLPSAARQERQLDQIAPSGPETAGDLAEIAATHQTVSSTGPEEIDGSEGELINSPKTLPIFAHMPHIMNEQGNKKLGKRDGARDVLDYIRAGFLPETLISFIATLGWNDGTEQEIFTRSELIEKFSLERVGRSGARFDEKRLTWMNGHFIRELNLEELAGRVEYFWPESAKKAEQSYRLKVLALAQDRLKTLRDLPSLTSYFFEEPRCDLELIDSNKQLKKLSKDEQISLLRAAHDALANLDDFSAESIQARLNQLLDTTGQKPGVLFSLIRIATTWAPFSPQLDATLALLGRETTAARLQRSIDFLS